MEKREERNEGNSTVYMLVGHDAGQTWGAWLSKPLFEDFLRPLRHDLVVEHLLEAEFRRLFPLGFQACIR